MAVLFNMELIKKIKDAEKQAKTLIEEANNYSVESEKASAKQKQEKLKDALSKRRELIAKAQQDGKSQGQVETVQMKQQNVDAENDLKSQADAKSAQAVTKITDFITSQGA